jgi:hypothetical protein
MVSPFLNVLKVLSMDERFHPDLRDGMALITKIVP